MAVQPPPPSVVLAAQHQKRAQYFRTMALTASTADVALTLVRLALHYERLAKEAALRPPSAEDSAQDEVVR
jgi:hypothetical protein